MSWTLLIISLPTENATVRMRVWRTIKASGAVSLRDGVYLLPATVDHLAAFDPITQEIRAGGGVAHVFSVDYQAHDEFRQLFNRSAEYEALQEEIRQQHALLTMDNAPDVIKQGRKLRKRFARITQVDFFPDATQSRVEADLLQLESDAHRILSPDEPVGRAGAICRLHAADYQGKVWATRARPWVDRLASAWLIRQFIDSSAQMLWLASPDDCPDDALGFDFDGATFTHVADKVTFEVLLASFGLNDPALQRLASVVHYLDVGGTPVAEATGIESVLAGLRASFSNDDELLHAAEIVFNSLITAWSMET
ncbi:MAG: chromate resistance protein ChrB domain-containing protein [Pseudomonadota bacterium]|nr:chromate resistance protein [Gammaproteobacteria bacterium]MBJ54893.1 chromate resistance protein [Gammaproteobacteria bacterium]MEC8858817.1 chromate resistance protein ChrB domain-containing protein [Pseudomonadota bacterium]HBN15974.1 chromate resistance protein [Pseudohongiella sp.]|tara:strand:+ start:494 stop:1423 length:930 start_codon:yes stop_codon:yes gene_type:complete